MNSILVIALLVLLICIILRRQHWQEVEAKILSSKASESLGFDEGPDMYVLLEYEYFIKGVRYTSRGVQHYYVQAKDPPQVQARLNKLEELYKPGYRVLIRFSSRNPAESEILTER